MKITFVQSQAKGAAQERYTIGYIPSKDGTTIGYRQYGHGPEIVLVQGTMGTAHHFMQLALFEPPLFVNRALPTALIARYEKEMSQGKVTGALITGMKASQLGPPLFNALPRWLLELLTNMRMKHEEKKGSGGYPPMKKLASTLHNDFQLVGEMNNKLESFKAVGTQVLLLGGSKSPAYLKAALAKLEKVLPHSRRIEFPGLGHAAAWNNDRGSQPEAVAEELRSFFT